MATYIIRPHSDGHGAHLRIHLRVDRRDVAASIDLRHEKGPSGTLDVMGRVCREHAWLILVASAFVAGAPEQRIYSQFRRDIERAVLLQHAVDVPHPHISINRAGKEPAWRMYAPFPWVWRAYNEAHAGDAVHMRAESDHTLRLRSPCGPCAIDLVAREQSPLHRINGYDLTRRIGRERAVLSALHIQLVPERR